MTRVIVVEVEGKPVGMVVDSASQVVRVPADQFDPPPTMVGEGLRDFITAVGKTSDRLIIMIDVDRILSTEDEPYCRQSPLGGEGICPQHGMMQPTTKLQISVYHMGGEEC